MPVLPKCHGAYITTAVMALIATACAACAAALPWLSVSITSTTVIDFAPFSSCVKVDSTTQCGYYDFDLHAIYNAQYWPFFGGFAAALSCLFSFIAFILALSSWCGATGVNIFLFIGWLFQTAASILGVYFWWTKYKDISESFNWAAGLYLAIIAFAFSLFAMLTISCGVCCAMCGRESCWESGDDDDEKADRECCTCFEDPGDRIAAASKRREARALRAEYKRSLSRNNHLADGDGGSGNKKKSKDKSSPASGRGKTTAAATKAKASSPSSQRRKYGVGRGDSDDDDEEYVDEVRDIEEGSNHSRKEKQQPSQQEANTSSRSARAAGMAGKPKSFLPPAVVAEWGFGGGKEDDSNEGSGGGSKKTVWSLGGMFGFGAKSTSTSTSSTTLANNSKSYDGSENDDGAATALKNSKKSSATYSSMLVTKNPVYQPPQVVVVDEDQIESRRQALGVGTNGGGGGVTEKAFVTNSVLISRALEMVSATPGDVATVEDMLTLIPRVQQALEDVASKAGRDDVGASNAILATLTEEVMKTIFDLTRVDLVRSKKWNLLVSATVREGNTLNKRYGE